MTMQAITTALIVALAFAYVAWRYLPRGWRSRFAAATTPPTADGAFVVRAPPATACGSGCSACSECPVGGKASGRQAGPAAASTTDAGRLRI